MTDTGYYISKDGKPFDANKTGTLQGMVLLARMLTSTGQTNEPIYVMKNGVCVATVVMTESGGETIYHDEELQK